MVKDIVFEVIKKTDLKPETNVIDSTLSYKKKE